MCLQVDAFSLVVSGFFRLLYETNSKIYSGSSESCSSIITRFTPAALCFQKKKCKKKIVRDVIDLGAYISRTQWKSLWAASFFKRSNHRWIDVKCWATRMLLVPPESHKALWPFDLLFQVFPEDPLHHLYPVGKKGWEKNKCILPRNLILNLSC